MSKVEIRVIVDPDTGQWQVINGRHVDSGVMNLSKYEIDADLSNSVEQIINKALGRPR